MDIPGQWWTLFRSPELNALVEEALRANPDVTAAQAALRQANELVYADQASLFLSVSGNVQKAREKVSGVTSGLPESPILTVSSASLSVSYAPDVFGTAGSTEPEGGVVEKGRGCAPLVAVPMQAAEAALSYLL